MTDTHCHLSFPEYDTDRDAVLGRARSAGLRWLVNPGTDVEQSRAAVALAAASPFIRAAIGVHPHDVGQLTEDAFAEIERLAGHPRVVAIGEVGLEKSARAPSLAVQDQWLRRFVRLAQKLEKPLIFHVRDAHAEFREFLTEVQLPRVGPRARTGVVHCFSGTLQDAHWYIQHGLFLGITGIVTFPNAGTLRGVVREAALGSLLLETDAPFLAPQRHRGERNEPAYVREVAGEIAALRDIPVGDVLRVTDESADELFSLEIP